MAGLQETWILQAGYSSTYNKKIEIQVIFVTYCSQPNRRASSSPAAGSGPFSLVALRSSHCSD
ncbi:MAG TPA: hypothetical protein VGO37_12185, partial [Steroidobacteraceae bacterium]|nr:hypothetical protein [Steroidobacteraceae bacterium]